MKAHIAWPRRHYAELHDELHARPALLARPPCVVSYWMHWGMDAAYAEAALAGLCRTAQAPLPAPDVRHHVVHGADFALKYERHGEFVSWQVNRALTTLPDTPSDAELRRALLYTSAIGVLPPEFVQRLSGEGSGRMLAATHIVMLPTSDDEWLERCRALLAAQAQGIDTAVPVIGAWIGDARRCALLSNLQLQPCGFTRFVLLDFGLPPDHAARQAQRLCEIEAYRTLAMLAVPIAQQESLLLAQIEHTLTATVDAMANDAAHDDANAFDTLTRLAAEVEHGIARTRYRFSATRAYHRIVEQRLDHLREQRIAGVQRLSIFLSRRFEPAMALCERTDARLTDVAERINRAVSLARVRLEMQREASNQVLFKALAHRQKLQLQLQQTVEGLSAVVISYYALGLVAYLAKAAKGLTALEPLHLQPDVVVGAAVLPVLLGVAWFIERLHRNLNSG